MIDTGILMDDDPVELLQGYLITRERKTPHHSFAVNMTHNALANVISPNWHVNSYGPVTMKDSEPEPDVTVIKGDIWDYSQRHPRQSEVGMLVEVSETSLGIDRVIKKRMYAAAGIPVYWIINLLEKQVEVYTHPNRRTVASDYSKRHDFRTGDIVPVVLENRKVGRIVVSDILP
jgi:Uma2 family endonuclease